MRLKISSSHSRRALHKPVAVLRSKSSQSSSQIRSASVIAALVSAATTTVSVTLDSRNMAWAATTMSSPWCLSSQARKLLDHPALIAPTAVVVLLVTSTRSQVRHCTMRTMKLSMCTSDKQEDPPLTPVSSAQNRATLALTPRHRMKEFSCCLVQQLRPLECLSPS